MTTSPCPGLVRETDNVTAELIGGFADWLNERDAPDTAAFASHAEMFLDGRESAPLATLDDDDLREFLLGWCPRKLSSVAVDHERAGLGTGMLQDVFARFIGLSDDVGCRGLLVHAESTDARNFYLHLVPEFEPSPTDGTAGLTGIGFST